MKYHISHGEHQAKTRDMICDMLRRSVQSRLRLWLVPVLEQGGGARPTEVKEMETRRKANIDVIAVALEQRSMRQKRAVRMCH